MLGADHWLPRRARLDVIVKPPVHHNGADDAVTALLLECRRSILEDLPEPDLLAGRN
jgi:hypothetical protein